ncbi:MAG: hypothetical protein ABI696_03080 [Rubrivivax sp.]
MPQTKLDQLTVTPGIKLVAPVPKLQTQEGPTCGFYALSIVMQYWRARDALVMAPPARARDRTHQPEDVRDQFDPGPSLRKLGGKAAGTSARALGPTGAVHPGGMFDIRQIAQVAKAVQGLMGGAQYAVEIVTHRDPDAFQQAIVEGIDAGIPPITAFDVKSGDPAQEGGRHAHWGVVIGYFKQDGVLHFAATHGHGNYYVWTARALTESNFGLEGGVSEDDEWVKATGVPDREGIRAALQRVDKGKLDQAKVLFAQHIGKFRRPQWSRAADPTQPNASLGNLLVSKTVTETRRVNPVQLNLAHHILKVRPA